MALVTFGYLTFPYLSLTFLTFNGPHRALQGLTEPYWPFLSFLFLPFLTFTFLCLLFLTVPYLSLPFLTYTRPYRAIQGLTGLILHFLKLNNAHYDLLGLLPQPKSDIPSGRFDGIQHLAHIYYTVMHVAWMWIYEETTRGARVCAAVDAGPPNFPTRFDIALDQFS